MTLGLAAVLPMIIFLSLQFGFSFRAERETVESAALERAKRIMSMVDGEIERSKATARALTAIQSIDEQNWPEADRRMREFMALNDDWRSVRLWDLDAHRELIDTDRPYGPARPMNPSLLARLPVGAPVTVSGIDTGCLCVHILAPVMQNGRPRYLVVVNLDSGAFQNLLLKAAPAEGVTAIVDRRARFIARTLHYEQRRGLPATRFVRDAIRRGTGGLYSGKTYEGLVNYTAYSTSVSTGWSTHIAIMSSALDGPQRLWRLATMIAALLSTLLAIGLAWIGLRAMAAERRSNERLQQAQRLEAIGKLTGGIAHDFNNMLAIITGSLDIAKRRLASGNTDVGRYVDNAMEGARRAADLTRRMLAFSRRQTLEPATIDVNALIGGMHEMMETTLQENIRIECVFELGVWPIHVDPGQLENAMLNLAVNARDAMPDGGTLTIMTRNVHGSGEKGDQVAISVSDTGTGMAAEVKAKAFEPFFSTKEIGRGTGLGLSQIYGFVMQSGGSAEIESRVGVGTTVSILLPRASGTVPAPQTKVTPLSAPTARAGETILIVEDDDDVRRTTVEALEELGYKVLETSDPRAALAMLEQGRSVSLLFTDIMMPIMDGPSLVTAALKVDPALKVLFTTGYERDDTLDICEGSVLRKPYTFEKLARNIREVLDR